MLQAAINWEQGLREASYECRPTFHQRFNDDL